MNEPDDAFEPTYSPRKVEFWLAHWGELDTLVHTPKSSAHIAEHLSVEWMHLQVRLRFCLCHEAHATDSLAVDPSCQHSPSGGHYRGGPETALCIFADLHHASSKLPPVWLATRKIWQEQLVPRALVDERVLRWRLSGAVREREPAFARSIAVDRMARFLGWQPTGQVQVA